jgi:hypothetical protein
VDASTYALTMLTFSEVPAGESFAVSATLFTTYLKCPQQALARLQGVYPQPSRASFRGALAHRVIARHLTDGPIEEEDLPLVCRQETGASLNGQLAAVGLKPSEFGAVVSEVSELYGRFRSLPTDDFDTAELPFEEEVAEGIILRGRIDAIFGTRDESRIVDWKTGAELGPDVDAQLGFYALAWRYRTGNAPVMTEAMSVRTGERVSARPTASDLARTEHEVASMIIALRSATSSGEELHRVAGPYCRWCPLLDTCPEGSAAVSLLD